MTATLQAFEGSKGREFDEVEGSMPVDSEMRARTGRRNRAELGDSLKMEVCA
ncbi:MAG: hypothetical protein IT515_02500 [Burkholderiales bacterium]|nr:hypothetical protein [Burkholderiales bacterium]